MKKLYQKNELTFALVWIGVYVLTFSLADSVSETFGIEKVNTAPLGMAITVFLLFWLKKQALFEKYGLVPFAGNRKSWLYFAPLVLVCSCNLWNGVRLNFTVAETVLYIVSMLCVGFLEEVIFRGFLFKALCKDSVRTAVVVSSVTFGFGHLVNLLNGAATLATVLQVFYAVAIGFLFTVIFYRGGSLLPCIAAHGVFNALSAFGVEGGALYQVVTAVILIVLPVGYGVWILHHCGAPVSCSNSVSSEQ